MFLVWSLGRVLLFYQPKIQVGKCPATRESSHLLRLNFTFLKNSVKLLVFVFSLNWVSCSGFCLKLGIIFCLLFFKSLNWVKVYPPPPPHPHPHGREGVDGGTRSMQKGPPSFFTVHLLPAACSSHFDYLIHVAFQVPETITQDLIIVPFICIARKTDSLPRRLKKLRKSRNRY